LEGGAFVVLAFFEDAGWHDFNWWGEDSSFDCGVGFVAAAAIATIHKVYNETKTDEIDPNLLERSNQWNVMGLGFNS
jgi:hypothetical protein